MFDIGWSEFLVIGIVALVVIGPKDLPRVMRTVGQWVRKARSIAAEFQTSIEEMAREAELADLRREIAEANAKLTKPFDEATIANGDATTAAREPSPFNPGDIHGPPYRAELLAKDIKPEDIKQSE